jgi:hypothetical protein
MRYRMMASYQGAPYEANIGPSGADVVLFAACPPPEDLGFQPAAGYWRKEVHVREVQAVWESRPMGRFRGAPCLILDDLGDRLHVAYCGHDHGEAMRLGFWQIDRGVFELVAPRGDVTDVVEERVDYLAGWAERGPQPGDQGYPGNGRAGPGWACQRDYPEPGPPDPALTVIPPTAEPPLPVEAAALAAAVAGRTATAAEASADPRSPGLPVEAPRDHGRRRRPRGQNAAQQVFCELASLAGIPPAAFSLGAEVEGRMCLLQTAAGRYEVFCAAGGARHEVRSFADEESAFFYLFGVLAADAVRTGHLMTRDDLVSAARLRA